MTDDIRYMSHEQRIAEGYMAAPEIKQEVNAVETCFCGKTVTHSNGIRVMLDGKPVECPRNCGPHNIYYEIPGAGGGNDQYQTREDAQKAYEEIVTAYPDCYCEWSYDGVGAQFVVRSYDGSQND